MWLTSISYTRMAWLAGKAYSLVCRKSVLVTARAGGHNAARELATWFPEGTSTNFGGNWAASVIL